MIAERFDASQDLNIPDVAEDLALYASELGFTLPAAGIVSSEFGFVNSKDFDASGRTQRTDHSHFLRYMDIGFRPWDKHVSSKDYVKNLDKDLVLPTWGLLYCGGAKVVQEELNQIADEFRICLHVESFAW
jgi:hypothetical protein